MSINILYHLLKFNKASPFNVNTLILFTKITFFIKINTEMVATENYFPEVYNDFLNFIGKEEQKIYTEQLFAQFEKMYNRKLSSQEKDMIKLAYIMGKTNQFSK